MTARQQLARLLPLAALVALAIIGLRGKVAGPRWDGPLKAYGVIIGIALEVILGALLLITYYREHAARRQADEALLAAAASTRARPPASAAGGAGAGGAAADGEDDDPDDDRDVAASLRFLLKLLLGTAMAAIAVVLVANLHLHLFTGNASRGPLIRFPRKLPKTPKPVPAGASPFHFPVTPVLYGLLIIALIAALAFSIWWGRRLAAAAAARPEAIPGDLAEEAEGLREAVASGRAALADLDDARAAIIACYAAMERSLAERGAERGAAGTPDELLDRAVRAGLLRGSDGRDSGGRDSGGRDHASHHNAARTLTALFYEARFSSHPLGPGQREAAARALDELAAELGGAPAGAGRTGAAR
jgi:Domain of unknown function (DUF4129)